MPTAGRVSRPAGGVGDAGDGDTVVFAGDGEGVVVAAGGLVVGGTVVSARDGEGVVVAAGGDATGGGMAGAGAGAVTMGGGMAVTGAGRVGGTLVGEDGVSTLVGVSLDSEVERNAMTPKIPPSASAKTVRTSPAIGNSRRRRDSFDVSSVATLHTSSSSPANAIASSASGSGSTCGAVTVSRCAGSGRTCGAVAASPTAGSGSRSGGAGPSSSSGSGRTCGGAMASTTSAAGGAGMAAAGRGARAGWVGVAFLVCAVGSSVAGMYGPRRSFDSRAVTKSRHRRNLSLGFFLSARPNGASR